MRLWKRDRRKNLYLRSVIDSNEQEAEAVRQLSKTLVAHINGDADWLRRRLLKSGEKLTSGDEKNGPIADCLPGNNN